MALKPVFGEKSTLKMILIFLLPIIGSLAVVAFIWVKSYFVTQKSMKTQTVSEIQLSQIIEMLKKVESAELFSLNPIPQHKPLPNSLYRYRILQQIDLAGDENFRLAKLDMTNTFTETPQSVAVCFNPRHAIRIQYEGKTIDFLICFECRKTLVKGLQKEFYLYHRDGTKDFLTPLLESQNKFKNASLEELYKAYIADPNTADHLDVSAIIGERLKQEAERCDPKVIRDQIKFISDSSGSADESLGMNLVPLLEKCEEVLISELKKQSKKTIREFHDRLEWGVANEYCNHPEAGCIQLNYDMRKLSRTFMMKSNLDEILGAK